MSGKFDDRSPGRRDNDGNDRKTNSRVRTKTESKTHSK
jgi:hypothetical protein